MFRWPQSSLRSLRRPHMDSLVPRLGHRGGFFGVDRLHTPMAQAIASTLENPSNGLGGFHRATGHRPQHGVEYFSRRLRGFGRRVPVRQRSRRYPMRCVSTMRREPKRTRICPHSTPRKGCHAFYRSLNYPEDPWGKTPWVLRAIDALTKHNENQSKPLPDHSHRSS
jgi:hypothetical protein